MIWSSRKKTGSIFCTFCFARRKSYKSWSQWIVHWMHFQNRHTFIYQKTLLHALFFLFKIVEIRQCVLMDKQSKWIFILNYCEKNMMKQCNILVFVWFVTSKVGLDFYYNKTCILISSRVAKQLKTLDLSKLRKITRDSKLLGRRAYCPVNFQGIRLWS